MAQIDMSKIYMPMWIHLSKDKKFSRPGCPKRPALRQRPLSRPLKAAIERVPLGYAAPASQREASGEGVMKA